MTAAFTGYVTLWSCRAPQHRKWLTLNCLDSRTEKAGEGGRQMRCAPAAGITQRRSRRTVLLSERLQPGLMLAPWICVGFKLATCVWKPVRSAEERADHNIFLKISTFTSRPADLPPKFSGDFSCAWCTLLQKVPANWLPSDVQVSLYIFRDPSLFLVF